MTAAVAAAVNAAIVLPITPMALAAAASADCVWWEGRCAGRVVAALRAGCAPRLWAFESCLSACERPRALCLG